MIIKYDVGLGKQSFYEQLDVLKNLKVTEKGGKDYTLLGEIDNPVVALDKQELRQMNNGSLIQYLFVESNIPVVTEYDGVYNGWYKEENTWPAAIDSLVHLEGQRKAECLSKAKKVLDVGCGTGIAGFYAAEKNLNIEHVRFSDIEAHCVGSACRNSDISSRKNFTSYERSDALKDMSEKNDRYDVILASAIPATPVYPELNRPINYLFEGTQFLEDLLRDAPKHLQKGGKLILSHSSVGEKAFNEFAKKYGAKVDEVLYERDNAFRTEFLGDQNWVDFLVDEGGLTIKNERGYPYWHNVKVKEISFD